MIYERHTLLSSWLIHLGVPADVAAADACKMEHVISKESFEAIKRHVYENNEVLIIRFVLFSFYIMRFYFFTVF